MLSSHSPSTCSRAPGSPRRQLVHAPGAPALVAATEGMPLACLTLMARRARVPVPQTVTPGEPGLGWLPLLGHSTHSRLEHARVFLGKKPICFPEALARGADVQIRTCIEAPEILSKTEARRSHRCTFSLLTTARQYLPERSLYRHSAPQFLCPPGDTSRSPGSSGRGLALTAPQDYVYLHT